MPRRERLEVLGLLAGALLILAFIASFALGLLQPVATHPAAGGSEPSRLPDVVLPAVVRGRIEVLNGSGRSGLARQATELLRTGGFDVVYFGNATSRPDSSEVIDRVGRPEIARAAAQQLGIARVRTARDSTLLLDATIVLGRDWGGHR